MKKISLFIVISFLFSTTVFSQNTTTKRETTGARVKTTTGTNTPSGRVKEVSPQQQKPTEVKPILSEAKVIGEGEKPEEKDIPAPQSFFDESGVERADSPELKALADTLVKNNPRFNDVVWSRTVYRVIDMRDKQNFQLYFPMRQNDQYRSFFRTLLDAIASGVPVYKRNPRDIKPDFKDVLNGFELSHTFAFDEDNDNNILQVDTITEQRTVNIDQYMQYVKNQLKFLIQEKVYFDKQTSRLGTKIMAIAPMYALHPDNMEQKETMNYFRNSVLCWIKFDELRPYLVKQYITPRGNDSERLTLDDFFQQKLYSSYLLGDSNMYSRMLLDYVVDEAKLKAEQNRIETELMNFEQDLWEY